MSLHITTKTWENTDYYGITHQSESFPIILQLFVFLWNTICNAILAFLLVYHHASSHYAYMCNFF